MLFRDSELQKLITQAEQDEKKLAQLQEKLRTLEPAWNQAQAECERLEALRSAQDNTYARSVCEEFWKARGPRIQQELEAAIAKRDSLTTEICAEIASLKQNIFHRNSVLSGSFANWAWQVVEQLPVDSPLRGELLGDRKKCETATHLAEIVAIVTNWSRRIEEMETTTIPLLRVADWIHLAMQAAGA